MVKTTLKSQYSALKAQYSEGKYIEFNIMPECLNHQDMEHVSLFNH